MSVPSALRAPAPVNQGVRLSSNSRQNYLLGPLQMRFAALGIVTIGILCGCAPYNHHFYDVDVPGRELSNRCGVPETALFPYHGIYMRVQINSPDPHPSFRLAVYVPEGITARFLSDSVIIDESPRSKDEMSKKYQLLSTDPKYTGLATSTSTMKGGTFIRKNFFGDLVSHKRFAFGTEPDFLAISKDGLITLPGMEINGVQYPSFVIPYRATSKFVFAALNGC